MSRNVASQHGWVTLACPAKWPGFLPWNLSVMAAWNHKRAGERVHAFNTSAAQIQF